MVLFQIKLKLNNDLKTNMKHTERYLKYLDIAEKITKTKTKSGTGTHYPISLGKTELHYFSRSLYGGLK